MKKLKFLFPNLILLMAITACKSSSPEIDDERIIGVWHQTLILENGIAQNPADSTIYVFSPDAVMQIKVFPDQAAAPPDQVYSYALSEGILSYWSLDNNVSESVPVSLTPNTLRITQYSTTIFEFEKIY